ncbi:MAG: hypothetical protein IH865_11845 [Chloroflexi bacterium]|nr:hypothetical protein [Chloroflexota bacterium]
MPTLWVRIGVLAVLVTAVVVGGIFVLRQLDSETDEVSVPIDFSDFYLSGRDEFSICVDAVGDAQSSEDHVAAVREALDIAFDRALQIAPDRLKSIPAELLDPVFVEGCPKPRLLSKSLESERPFDRSYRNETRRDAYVGGPGGGQLSPHREFMYFVDQDTYSDAFGTEPYAEASEQFSTGTGIIYAVTVALYLPEGADSRAIQDGLLVTLNLVSASELESFSITETQPNSEIPTAPPPELGYETWEDYYQGVLLPISEGRTPTIPGPAPGGFQPDPSHGGSVVFVTPTPAPNY